MDGTPTPRTGRWMLWSANLALLVLYPLAWISPLAKAGLVPWFGGREISIFNAVRGLWDSDAALAVLVALFAVVVPYAKTLALAAVHSGFLGPRGLPMVEAIGKLSMADVFLVALFITVTKGVGLGYVETAWGLWLFTGCVVAQIGISWVTARQAWA